MLERIVAALHQHGKLYDIVGIPHKIIVSSDFSGCGTPEMTTGILEASMCASTDHAEGSETTANP